MRHPQRQIEIVEHDDPADRELQNPDEFLDRNHPENDGYMQAVEHVQRQIMHANSLLRTKQVNIIKTVFAGNNFTQTAKMHKTSPPTVSRLVKSANGQRLLTLLQYHLKLIEGPNEAQRRSMLWRIALREEEAAPKTAIAALAELNKMHFQHQQLEQALTDITPSKAPTVVINIDQNLLPKTKLDS